MHWDTTRHRKLYEYIKIKLLFLSILTQRENGQHDGNPSGILGRGWERVGLDVIILWVYFII